MQDAPVHPTSGASILGSTLPHWSAVLALVIKAQESIDDLQTVGPVIVEANWRYDIDIVQVAYKKGFRQVLEEKLPR